MSSSFLVFAPTRKRDAGRRTPDAGQNPGATKIPLSPRAGDKNVRLHGRIHPNKFQLDQTIYGRLSAIIYFNRPDSLQTVPDSYTITINRNVRFQGLGGIYPDTF